MTKKKPPRPPADRETRVFPPTDARSVSPADVAPGRAEEPSVVSVEVCTIEPGWTDPAPDPAPRMVGPRHSSPLFDEHQGGLVWVLDELWAGRAKKLAAAMNKKPEAFLESLLHRAWTSAPLSVRNREL